MDLNELQLPQALIAKPKRKRKGNYAGDPKRKGSGLWMKPAFDLIIAKRGCIYARKYEVSNDKKIQGTNEKKVVKICNGCIFLVWDRGYNCDK